MKTAGDDGKIKWYTVVIRKLYCRAWRTSRVTGTHVEYDTLDKWEMRFSNSGCLVGVVTDG